MQIGRLAKAFAFGASMLAAPASVLADTHACIVKEVKSFSDYDTSATSFGCLYGDCRRALSFRLND